MGLRPPESGSLRKGRYVETFSHDSLVFKTMNIKELEQRYCSRFKKEQYIFK